MLAVLNYNNVVYSLLRGQRPLNSAVSANTANNTPKNLAVLAVLACVPGRPVQSPTKKIGPQPNGVRCFVELLVLTDRTLFRDHRRNNGGKKTARIIDRHVRGKQ